MIAWPHLEFFCMRTSFNPEPKAETKSVSPLALALFIFVFSILDFLVPAHTQHRPVTHITHTHNYHMHTHTCHTPHTHPSHAQHIWHTYHTHTQKKEIPSLMPFLSIGWPTKRRLTILWPAMIRPQHSIPAVWHADHSLSLQLQRWLYGVWGFSSYGASWVWQGRPLTVSVKTWRTAL